MISRARLSSLTAAAGRELFAAGFRETAFAVALLRAALAVALLRADFEVVLLRAVFAVAFLVVVFAVFAADRGWAAERCPTFAFFAEPALEGELEAASRGVAESTCPGDAMSNIRRMQSGVARMGEGPLYEREDPRPFFDADDPGTGPRRRPANREERSAIATGLELAATAPEPAAARTPRSV